MSETNKLHSAYALETPDDSRALYAGWAETYDADFVDARGYILHLAVAQAFASAGGSGPVLDLGAGTGICGQALAACGITRLHATDIAPEMIEVARAKNVYETLFVGDILAGLDVANGTYPGVVSSGTFTCGHVGAEGLDEIARILSPDGLAVISVRDIHFDSAGFASKIAELDGVLTLEARPTARIYAPDQTGENADDKALLLYLRRRR